MRASPVTNLTVTMALLSCSSTAADMIRRLVAVHDVDPDRGGLRLGLSTASRSLSMTMVNGPEADDVVVVAEHGARVFLDGYALSRTEDMLLESSRAARADVFVLQPVEDRARRDEQTADRLRRYLRGQRGEG